MFYISDFDKEKRLWIVTDTSDNVSEGYPFKKLREISKSIKIIGMSDYAPSICGRYGNVVISRDGNVLNIHRIKDSVITDSLDSQSIRHERNTPFLSYISFMYETKNTVVVKLELSIKYDYEFTGFMFVKIDTKNGYLMRKSDIFFVCDSKSEIKRIKSETCNDCPNFISSKEANKLLRECGVV